MTKRLVIVTVLLTFLFSSAPVFAEDMMQKMLRDSLYGGIIGGVLGLAVMLLTDNPEDNLEYIPTGAAIGILTGAAYGIASSDVVGSVAEYDYDDGELDLRLPVVKTYKLYDKNSNVEEVVASLELLKLKF